MKLNMGCGHNRREGYVNVDAFPDGGPDEVWDLEQTPWPWPDDCAQEIVFNHSLEHMGGDPKVFLSIMKELYRISAPGCRIVINVPHPRHDDFLGDPTHVRAISPQMLSLFDRDLNDRWKATGAANSPLAHYTGVNFRMLERNLLLDEPYRTQLQQGEITGEALAQMVRERNNVAREFRIVLEAVKP